MYELLRSEAAICLSYKAPTITTSYCTDLIDQTPTLDGVKSCKVKVKVKFTLEQAAKAQRGSRCIALLFLQPRRQMGVGGQRHAPAALSPGKTRYPLYRRPGGPQGRSVEVRKISPPTGFDDRPVSSESLYRLRYASSKETRLL